MKKILITRRVILFTIFLLTPIIQFYFSPFLPVSAALHGAITISLFVFAALFIIGIFFGRAPCGWLMPCGGLQDACSNITDKRIKAGKKDRIKYFIFAGWLIALVSILLLNAHRWHFDLFYLFENGISVSNVYGYIPYYAVLFTVFILAIVFGRRPMCHYACWIAPFMISGRKLGNMLKIPALRIITETEKCIGCKSCTNACPMGIEVDNLAAKGTVEHSECIMCMECVNICRNKVFKVVVR